MLRLRPFPIAACLLPLVLTACGDSSNLDDPRTQAPLVRVGVVERSVETGRSFTGIERERKYFDIACERIARAQAQGSLLPPEPAPEPVQEGLL